MCEQEDDGCVWGGREQVGHWTDAAWSQSWERHPGSSQPAGRGKAKKNYCSDHFWPARVCVYVAHLHIYSFKQMTSPKRSVSLQRIQTNCVCMFYYRDYVKFRMEFCIFLCHRKCCHVDLLSESAVNIDLIMSLAVSFTDRDSEHSETEKTTCQVGSGLRLGQDEVRQLTVWIHLSTLVSLLTSHLDLTERFFQSLCWEETQVTVIIMWAYMSCSDFVNLYFHEISMLATWQAYFPFFTFSCSLSRSSCLCQGYPLNRVISKSNCLFADWLYIL